jgi:ribosomal protein S18 acetylase RimI-like enzyme
MTATGAPRVRPYRPSDRAAVRRLCFLTGDIGAPAARYFPDEELFADLWMLYYTDAEPESFWVAEDASGVAGYLAGCLDDRRFRRRLWAVGPRVLWRALRRGSLFRPSLWRLLAANVPLWFRGGEPEDLPEGPSSHFHINLAPTLRGRGAGKALMEAYLAAAQKAGAAFSHAAVREDNAGARRFFESLGFQEKGCRPAFRTPGPEGREYAAVLYIKLFPANFPPARP